MTVQVITGTGKRESYPDKSPCASAEGAPCLACGKNPRHCNRDYPRCKAYRAYFDRRFRALRDRPGPSAYQRRLAWMLEHASWQ